MLLYNSGLGHSAGIAGFEEDMSALPAKLQAVDRVVAGRRESEGRSNSFG